MRNVLSSNDQVFHYWANRVQESGRAGNVFFEGDSLYSYGHHFCIARHLTGRVVAFTTQSYSMTTSHHISAARSAARHLQVVHVHDPAAAPSTNKARALESIAGDLAYAQRKGIRHTTRESRRANALEIALNFNAYLAALPEGEGKYVQPIDTTDLEGATAALIAQQQEREATRLREQQERAERLREALQGWKAGESCAFNLHGLPPALRLVERDGSQVVETSHGACIPVDDARKLWRVLNSPAVKGHEVRPPGGIKLGAYQLNTIRADGSIVVGCHDIAFNELEDIAKQLGLAA